MHWLLNGNFTDRGKLYSDKFNCPYMLCPSYNPDGTNRGASFKFIQRVSPRVNQYRCRHCGCLVNKGLDGPAVPEAMWAQNVNSRLVNKKKAFNLRNW